MQIYLARNNQQAGPYSLEQLNQMLASQQVLLTDLIWYKGLPEWKALGELTQGKFVFQPEGLVPSNHPTTLDIQNQPPNSSYQNPAYQHSNTQQVSTQNTSKAELASIGSRIFAKIIDMLLWLPSLILLMSFF